MFISSISIESLLGGGAGVVLGLGNAGPVLGEASRAVDPINEQNLVSRVCNLLDTMPPRLNRLSLFVIKYLDHWFKSPYIGAYPIDSPHKN